MCTRELTAQYRSMETIINIWPHLAAYYQVSEIVTNLKKNYLTTEYLKKPEVEKSLLKLLEMK